MMEATPKDSLEDVSPVRCPMCFGAGAVAVKVGLVTDEQGWVSRAARKLLKIREKLGIAPVALIRRQKPKKLGDAVWKGKHQEEPPVMTEEGDVVLMPDGKTPYRSKYQ